MAVGSIDVDRIPLAIDQRRDLSRVQQWGGLEVVGRGVRHLARRADHLHGPLRVDPAERVLLGVAEIVAVVANDRDDSGHTGVQLTSDLLVEVGAGAGVDEGADQRQDQGHEQAEPEHQADADRDRCEASAH